MTTAVSSWLVLTAILGLSATIAIWSRRPTRWRGLSVAAFLVSSPLAAVALAMALGWAIPYWPGITVPPGKHPLIGHKLVEGVAIFVLLDVAGGEPRYYRLPWSIKNAEALQGALDRAGEDGEAGMRVPPFDPSLDELPPVFYAEPQQALPEKEPVEEAPVFGGDA